MLLFIAMLAEDLLSFRRAAHVERSLPIPPHSDQRFPELFSDTSVLTRLYARCRHSIVRQGNLLNTYLCSLTL